MAEENTAKTKRDLMWEQKKRMREEKIKSTFTSSQDYNNQPQKNEPNYSNPPVNFNENVRSTENLPQFFPEPKQENKNLNFNNIFTPFSNDNGKQPASVPSNERLPFNNEQNSNFVMRSNNEPFQNNNYNNNGRINQTSVEKYPNNNDNNFNNGGQNNFKSASPNIQKDDPNLLNNLMKKEYGEFLKNQIREKENKKGNMAGHNKVEQLQAAMEKQDYNPFGRPGGGGPNKKIINSNNQNPSNNNNYNNNYNNVNSGGGGRMESKKQEMDDYGQNQFQPNDYNALLQNNIQNLQKEKAKIQNYKNFMNQNEGYGNQNYQNQLPNQNYQPENNNNYYQQNQFNPNNNNNHHQNYNNNNNFNNNNNNYKNNDNSNNNYVNYPKSYDPPNNYENINNTVNQQPYHDDNNKNFNSVNAENRNNNIPSMKGVRTGRNRLMYENMGENELIKKESKAQEMQKALQEQIELKKRQKEMEKERQRMEEAAEEARLQKEREQLQYEIKMEEEKKKAKFEKVRQENLDLKEEKSSKKNLFNNNPVDVSKDVSKDFAENLVKKPIMLRTDVSKEFLEQEGKNSRRRKRKTNPNPEMFAPNIDFNNNENIMVNNNENALQTPKQDYNNNAGLYGAMNLNGNYGMNPTNDIARNGMINYGDERSSNRTNDMNDLQMRREMEIQNIKNDAKVQQKDMQLKLMEIQNEASNAIKMKNQAEQELLNLRQVLKEKVLEEEKYKRNLLLALTKNDPTTKRKTSTRSKPYDTPGGVFAMNDIMNYNTPAMGGDFTDFKRKYGEQQVTPKIYQNEDGREGKQNLIKPLKIFERGGITAGRDVFQEAYNGDKTLISDTKMIPLDMLDQFTKQHHDANLPLTLSKIGHLAVRPNSSNMYEGSNRYEKIINRQEESPKEIEQNYQVKKRPFSQKNPRYETNNMMEHSVNSEITREIDNILRTHEMELNGNNNNHQKMNTFNKAAQGVLDSSKIPNYHNEGMGIKLDSEFPTLKDQSLYSMKSYGLKKGDTNEHMDEIERIMKPKTKQQEKNNRYEDAYKETTLHSTINIDELNKKNDERLKEIDVMEKYMEGGVKNVNQRNINLRVIEEEDDIAKLDKLIKNM